MAKTKAVSEEMQDYIKELKTLREKFEKGIFSKDDVERMKQITKSMEKLNSALSESAEKVQSITDYAKQYNEYIKRCHNYLRLRSYLLDPLLIMFHLQLD